MQRYEVEAIFEQKKDGLFEDINISSQKPIAIILGGQPMLPPKNTANNPDIKLLLFVHNNMIIK